MEFSYEAMSSVPLGRQSVSHDSHMTSVQHWGHLFDVVPVLVLCHVTGHVTIMCHSLLVVFLIF